MFCLLKRIASSLLCFEARYARGRRNIFAPLRLRVNNV
jgi:hypothetical protein